MSRKSQKRNLINTKNWKLVCCAQPLKASTIHLTNT